MSTFILKFDLGNAAFDDDPTCEIVRILREWADKIEAGEPIDTYRTVYDINGNDIGRIKAGNL